MFEKKKTDYGLNLNQMANMIGIQVSKGAIWTLLHHSSESIKIFDRSQKVTKKSQLSHNFCGEVQSLYSILFQYTVFMLAYPTYACEGEVLYQTYSMKGIQTKS